MRPLPTSSIRDAAPGVAEPAPPVVAGRADVFPRTLPRLLFVGGLVGTLAAFVLTLERLALLANPSYVPSCSINPVISCGSVMTTPQAEVLGFPNPLIGLVAFPVVATIGVVMLSGVRPRRWIWLGLQAGTTAGVVFVHWLIFQSLYRIGALCPYCMVVWAITIPIFWYVTLATLARGRLPGPLPRLAGVVVRHHSVGLAIWLLTLCALVFARFFDYWSSLITL